MSNVQLKIYKRVLQEVSEKYGGAENFINSGIEESSCKEKLPAEEVTYFLCFLVSFLLAFSEIASSHKSIRNI